jgi:hypothetical protein
MTSTTDSPGCGRDVEELATYLDTGYAPDEQHIAQCPDCQNALAALRSLNKATRELAASDLLEAGTSDQPWLRNILNNLRLETRPGRSIPLRSDRAEDVLSQTEASIIALIRTVGDTISGATIGSCKLRGDPTEPGSPTDVEVGISAFYGVSLPDMAESVRTAVGDALATHTELVVNTINVTITDIRPMPAFPESTEQ